MGCCFSKNLTKLDPNMRMKIKGEVNYLFYIGR